MESDVSLFFSSVETFKRLPIAIQRKFVAVGMGEQYLGVDIEDIRCALMQGNRCEIFYSLPSFLSFVSESDCQGAISYKSPLSSLEDFACWADRFMPQITESNITIATMFSFDIKDDCEFYIAIF